MIPTAAIADKREYLFFKLNDATNEASMITTALDTALDNASTQEQFSKSISQLDESIGRFSRYITEFENATSANTGALNIAHSLSQLHKNIERLKHINERLHDKRNPPGFGSRESSELIGNVRKLNALNNQKLSDIQKAVLHMVKVPARNMTSFKPIIRQALAVNMMMLPLLAFSYLLFWESRETVLVIPTLVFAVLVMTINVIAVVRPDALLPTAGKVLDVLHRIVKKNSSTGM